MNPTEATTPPAQPEGPAPTADISNRPRTGKIARCPKSTRDKINQMLLDGVPYDKIIEATAQEAPGLIDMNLSRWRSGGYLDWLRNRQISEDIKAKYELAKDIISDPSDAPSAARAILHALAVNLTEFLAKTDPATLRESLLDDADKFSRFVNAMVRLADGTIKLQTHHFHTEDRLAQLANAKASDQPRVISQESLRKAEELLKLL
jgi:hypothetical protein